MKALLLSLLMSSAFAAVNAPDKAELGVPTNYFPNGGFERGAVGVTKYKDAAGVRPVDGAGGTATQITCTAPAASGLEGQRALVITSVGGASAQGEGCSIPFTIQPADKAKVIKLSFDSQVSSGTFVAGAPSVDSDIEVYVYDVTNATLIQPSTYKIFSNSSTISGDNSMYFQSASNSTSYLLIFHAATTSTAAYAIKIDKLVGARSQYTYGSPITDWTPYTMVIGATTTAPTKATTRLTDQAYWRRVGDSMEIKYDISWSSNTGAAAGSGVYLFPLPSGYTIDSSKIAISGTNTAVGVARVSDATNFFVGQAIIQSTSNLLLSGKYSGSGTTSSITDAAIGSTAFNLANPGTTYINFQAKVPISGWSSSVQMSDTTTQSLVSARMYKTTTQAMSGETKLTAWTVEKDRSGMWDSTNNRFNISVPGDYVLALNTQATPTSTATQVAAFKLNGGATVYLGTASNTSSSDRFGGAILLPDLKGGDYVELYHFTTAAVTVQDGLDSTHASFFRLPSSTSIGATDYVGATAQYSGTQVFTSGSQATISGWTKMSDSHGAFNTNGTYTCPAPGKYRAYLLTSMQAGYTANTGSMSAIMTQNGSTTISVAKDQALGAATTAPPGVDVQYTFDCKSGDTIVLQFAHSNGANRSLWNADANRNKFTIERVSGF